MMPETGSKKYYLRRVSDFHEDGMNWVGILRSPVSKGKLLSVAFPKTGKNYICLESRDIPGEKKLVFSKSTVPVLANGKVLYKGEAIGLVCGPDKNKVRDIIKETKVDIEEEEAYFDFECFDSRRLHLESSLLKGVPDEGFIHAENTVSGKYRSFPQDHYYPEPQGAAARYDYDKLTVYTSTQWPFHVRDSVQKVLGVKKDDVIVRPTLLGPHLDGKLWYPSLLGSHAALAAWASARPCLLLLGREEDFLFTTKRTPVSCGVKAAMDTDGKLLAIDARIAINTGAYSPLAESIVRETAESLVNLYECPAIRVKSWAIRTDLPSMGSFAGLGGMNTSFARERLADDCALASGIDPAEWRSINIIPTGKRKLSIWEEIKPVLFEMSDYKRKHSAYELMRKKSESGGSGFGIGLAVSSQQASSISPSQPARVELELSKDLKLAIRTSVFPATIATMEIWKSEASAITGIDIADIHIDAVSTDSVPDSGPAFSSRGVSVMSQLIMDACQAISKKRFREALPIKVSKVSREKAQEASDISSWAAAVVELKLDPLDRRPIVKAVWLAARTGKILSVDKAVNSLRRDTSLALGLCMSEFLDYVHGVDHEMFMAYHLQRLKDKPEIFVEISEIPEFRQPLGIGELAFFTVPAAFGNAMTQALDAPWNNLPGTQFPEYNIGNGALYKQ